MRILSMAIAVALSACAVGSKRRHCDGANVASQTGTKFLVLWPSCSDYFSRRREKGLA